ncbi:aldo/keto reductase [Mobiluncus porci]|uniref:Aldo/keto reductase n=1 Tax=Mobiluncus porci TaxID=2652278 RepID=A0A7K0K4E2_9ACTO|nr:aldo/keto reductase [Mobiluncus porci]MST50353.1 aldo/keto reductase [Mobiluncus porci]
MELRRLGNTGLQVSALGLGTLTWGRDTLEAECAAQLEAFIEAGGNLLDTSPTYGEGEAQKVLGSLLGTGGNRIARREDLVIVSKSGVNRRGERTFVEASRSAMLASLDDTLRELGTDYVDLWMVQVPDPETNFDVVLATLSAAYRSGKARYVGLSNHASWQVAYGAARLGNTVGGGIADSGLGLPGLAAVTNEYSLLNRELEREILPAATALGVGVLGWSALGRGVLTGKYRNSTPPDSRGASLHLQGFVKPYLTSEKRRIVESVATAAEGLHESVLAVSLAWVLSRPGLSSAIVGARTGDQLVQILRSVETKLPRQVATALNEVSDPINPLN